MKSFFFRLPLMRLCLGFRIGNFSGSSSAQRAEQTTVQNTGLGSMGAGRGSIIQRDIFGDKNLAKNDIAKPAAIIAAAVILIFVFKGKKRVG